MEIIFIFQKDFISNRAGKMAQQLKLLAMQNLAIWGDPQIPQ